jgi:chromosome segregation ATPase
MKEQQKNAVVSESSGEIEKLKKKNAKLKVDMDKLKTSLEIKEEMINDMKAELEELRTGNVAPEPAQGEEELTDYLHRASFHYQKTQ